MTRIERQLLRWLQRRCSHPGSEVAADVLQADARPMFVPWCRTCGAVGVGYEAPDSGTPWPEMRRPEPTWNR
jgi:hypothetical protein